MEVGGHAAWVFGEPDGDRGSHTQFDTAELTVFSPRIGPYAIAEYYLGQRQLQDIESGWRIELGRWLDIKALGAGRIGYYRRFGYTISGAFLEFDLPESERFSVQEDQGGIFVWEDLELYDPFYIGAGVAVGTVPDAVRFGYVEARFRQDEMVSFFVRASTAHSRLDEIRTIGFGGGADIHLVGRYGAQLLFSYNDFEIIDRLGSTGPVGSFAFFVRL